MVSMMLESLFREIYPQFIQDHLQITLFLGLLSYFLFFYNWVIHTNLEEKFNLVSLITSLCGLLHLHYSNVTLLFRYEAIFVSTWFVFFLYHLQTWHKNYRKVMDGKAKSLVRKRQSYIARYFITVPDSQNAVGHWEEPPLKNGIHLLLIMFYAFLLLLHAVPFLFGTTYPPFCPLSSDNNLCCRYNYAMEGFHDHVLSRSFCSADVNIAFAGSWSTGKTYVINAILGHEYPTAQSAPAPTTDKFTCITLGSPYRDVVRSDDYERRRHCEIMSHVGDVVGRTCDHDDGGGTSGELLANVLDVADDNEEFAGFVFFDMPGYQREYGEDCRYRNFYRQLIDRVDYTFVVWDVNHGKIEDEFAEFFQNKARGTNYEIIYNRYDESSTEMGFLNQQYGKMSGAGQEMLSEMYITRVHENTTAFTGNSLLPSLTSSSLEEDISARETSFESDIQLLRSKIKSVNQTVHDNRKKLMKANLVKHEGKLTGFFSLYKLKLSRRLVEGDLNLHIRPRGWFPFL